MGRHKAHAKFDRAEWRLRFLIPLWLLQTVLAVVILGVFAAQLRQVVEEWKGADPETGGWFPAFTVAWQCVNLALGVVAPVLVAYEMFRFFEETLTPRTMMATQFITMGIALAAMALDVFAHVRKGTRGKYTILALVIGSIFIISSLIPALYALRNHRRLAAYDELSHPTNTKPYGFTDPESQVRLHPSRASIVSTLSDSNVRRLSASSLLSIRRASVAAEEVPLRKEPVGVYNHERDTRFEEYVSKRNSGLLGGVEGLKITKEGGDSRRNSRLSLSSRDVAYRNSLGAGDAVNRNSLGTRNAADRNSLSPADAEGSSPNLRDTVDRAMRTEFGWGARSGSPMSLGNELGWKGNVGAKADVGRVPSSAGHSLDAVPETVEEVRAIEGIRVVKPEEEVDKRTEGVRVVKPEERVRDGE